MTEKCEAEKEIEIRPCFLSDIMKELYDALKVAGDIKDPKTGDTTKFRDIFTVREVIYNGNREIKRFL